VGRRLGRAAAFSLAGSAAGAVSAAATSAGALSSTAIAPAAIPTCIGLAGSMGGMEAAATGAVAKPKRAAQAHRHLLRLALDVPHHAGPFAHARTGAGGATGTAAKRTFRSEQCALDDILHVQGAKYRELSGVQP